MPNKQSHHHLVSADSSTNLRNWTLLRLDPNDIMSALAVFIVLGTVLTTVGAVLIVLFGIPTMVLLMKLWSSMCFPAAILAGFAVASSRVDLFGHPSWVLIALVLGRSLHTLMENLCSYFSDATLARWVMVVAPDGATTFCIWDIWREHRIRRPGAGHEMESS